MNSNSFVECESDEEDDEDLDAELDSTVNDDDTVLVRKRTRKKRITTEDLWRSPWGVLLRHPEVSISTSVAGTKFRLRFRVPFALFNDVIIPNCKRVNVFNMKNSSAIPLEFKVLILLRILARGNDLDTLCELSGVPISTCHNIFLTFIKSFTVNCFDEYVSMPTGDKMKEVMNTYKLLGFNGCVGSMDCTHIYWNKCPK
jgi:hypothetical protein